MNTAFVADGDPDEHPMCLCAPCRCRIDEKDPRYCECPRCETRYRTPIHHVLGLILRGNGNVLALLLKNGIR